MKNKEELKKASTSYLIGTLFNKGIFFLTVPIFTRLLSTSDYGVVTTYNSWTAILAMVMGFALHTGIRVAFIDYKNEMKDFLATVTSFTILSGFAISLIILHITRYFPTSINSTLIIVCLLQSMAAALIEDYSMYLMMQYKYRARTALMVFPNLIAVVVSVIVIRYIVSDNLYLGRIIPTALTMIIFGMLVVMLVYRNSKCVFNKQYLKYALSISLPLILHGIALNILSQSDRMMITWLADSSQTGIYSLIYNFGMIATVITTSLEGIWVPWFYRKLQDKNDREINIIVKDYVNLITYCLIGVIMIGPEIVKFLATSSYWDGIKIIPPVVISNFAIFSYSLYVNVEHFYKKTIGITINTLAAAILNIILNLFLIPKFGYVAAAYTTLASYLLSFFLHAIKSKKLAPKLFPMTYFSVPLIEILLATLLFYIFVDNLIIRWGAAILFIIAMFFKEWKRIVVYFPHLKRRI